LIVEIVKWEIKAGQEKSFEHAFGKAQKILSNSAGYISHKFQKCIEKPGRYALIVEWETLKDHTVGFQKSEAYQEYRALIIPYLEPGTTMEHYEIIYKNTL